MSRQSLQIGSEIIGIKKYNCENEIITLILEILKKNLKSLNFLLI